MDLESKQKQLEINVNDFEGVTDRHIYLKSEMAVALATVKKVYENEVANISYNTLCKIAINFLIEALSDVDDFEAIEILKNQHQEVLFL